VPAKTAAEIAALGPQVGQRVPDFRLVDQDGRTRDLKSVLGPNWAMLVFFRSAEW
jgi:peroxiredoxin